MMWILVIGSEIGLNDIKLIVVCFVDMVGLVLVLRVRFILRFVGGGLRRIEDEVGFVFYRKNINKID